MSALREAIDEALDRWDDIDPLDLSRQRVLDSIVAAVERVPVQVTIRELDMADSANIVTIRGIDNLQYVRDLVGHASEEGALHLTVDGGYLKIKAGDYGTWCAPIQTEVYGQ